MMQKQSLDGLAAGLDLQLLGPGANKTCRALSVTTNLG
jgi:hypothetical protein